MVRDPIDQIMYLLCLTAKSVLYNTFLVKSIRVVPTSPGAGHLAVVFVHPLFERGSKLGCNGSHL